MKIFTPLLSILLLAACLHGRAQPVAGTLDTAFHPALDASGSAELLYEFENGSLLMYGPDGVVKLTASGAVDISFVVPPEVDINRYDANFRELSDGGLMLFGGAYTGSPPSYQSMVKLLPSGALDPSFSPVKMPASMSFKSLTPLSGEKWLLEHSSYDLTSSLVSVIGANGQPDATLSPSSTRPMVAQGNQGYYLTGSPLLILGGSKLIQRYTMDGMPDPSWTAPDFVEGLGAEAVPDLFADGTFLVFPNEVGRVFSTTSSANFFRLGATGAQDPYFIPFTSDKTEPGYTYGRFALKAFSLEDQSRQKLLIATRFGTTSSPSIFGARQRTKLQLLHRNGLIDTSFNTAVLEQRLGSGAFDLAYKIKEDGKVNVQVNDPQGGYDWSLNGTPLQEGLVEFDIGSGNNTYTEIRTAPEVTGTYQSGGGEGPVYFEQLVLPDGRKVLISPYMSKVNNQPRSRLALLNADWSLNEGTFPSIGWSPAISYPNITGDVLRDGNLLLTGNFSSVQGQPREGIAKIIMTGSVPSSGFASWAAGFGVPGTPDAIRDSDRDSVPDLLEYAFNLNPVVSDPGPLPPSAGTKGLPAFTLAGTANGRRLQLSYLRRSGAETGGLSYAAEFSTTLNAGWQESGTVTATVPLTEGWERIEVQGPEITTGGMPCFGRVKVRHNP